MRARQILRRGGGRRCGPPSRSQRWGILGGRGNFEGGGSGGGELRAPWGPGSHGPNVSGGSVSEPAGAPAPPERKFFATSSETSDCRVQRGWGCNSEPQRLREAGEGSSRAEESRGDSRGSERGRGTSLAALGPRCPRTEAKGRASRRPPRSRSCGRPGAPALCPRSCRFPGRSYSGSGPQPLPETAPEERHRELRAPLPAGPHQRRFPPPDAALGDLRRSGSERGPEAPAALSEPRSHSTRPGGAAPSPRWAAPWRREAAAWAGLQSGAPRWKYTVSTTRLHPCIVSRRRARFSHSPAGTGWGVPDRGAGTRPGRTQDSRSSAVKLAK